MNDQLAWVLLASAISAASALFGFSLARLNYEERLAEQRDSFRRRAAAFVAKERSKLAYANRALLNARKELADARNAREHSALRTTDVPGLYVYDGSCVQEEPTDVGDVIQPSPADQTRARGFFSGDEPVDLKVRCIKGSDYLALASGAVTVAHTDLRARRGARDTLSGNDCRRAA